MESSLLTAVGSRTNVRVCSKRVVQFLEGFQEPGGSGSDSRYGCREFLTPFSNIGEGV